MFSTMPMPCRRFVRSSQAAAVLAILFFGLAFLMPTLGRAEDKPKPTAQIGRFVHIGLPINGQTYERTRRIVHRAIDQAKRENSRLTLVF